MMTWTGAVQVFACLEPTDMRKSFDGLCGVVELGMRRRVETGSLFLFVSVRRKTSGRRSRGHRSHSVFSFRDQAD